MNSPKYVQNTITQYSIKPKKIYGDFIGNARYGLLSVITICLGNRDCENELLGMLSTLLSPELRPEQKEVILQEYGIACRTGSDMTEKINQAIAELTEEGKVAEIAAKYNLTDMLVK